MKDVSHKNKFGFPLESLERDPEKLAESMDHNIDDTVSLQSIAISLLRMANSLEKLVLLMDKQTEDFK